MVTVERSKVMSISAKARRGPRRRREAECVGLRSDGRRGDVTTTDTGRATIG